MELTIESNKIYKEPQKITIPNNVLTFVGENGSGKSAILESIFLKHLNDINSDLRIICFSSGNNESFSSLFNNNIKKNRRFVINNAGDEEKVENAINVFYFDPTWVRLLIFFATAIKRGGKVNNYLQNKGIIDIDTKGVDQTTYIKFPFRIRKTYSKKIEYAIEQESKDFEYEATSIRKTFYHQYLTKLAEKIHRKTFDVETGEHIVKSLKSLKASDAALVLGTDTSKLFAFLAWATQNNQFIFKNQLKLFFKNGLELNDLSDGEHQLLAIYSIIDLFDAENTLFLLDEVDSHLYYYNIQKLWESFEKIQGKVITTTHSADSIILNQFTNIKLVQGGKIEEDTIAEKILKRLESLSSGHNYKLSIAGKLKYLALVEDYFDWFIFTELCKKSVPNFDASVLDHIHYIKCSSSFDSVSQIFGNSKLEWLYEFLKHGIERRTKSIFLICDRDNLPIADIQDSGLLKKSKNGGRKSVIQLPGGPSRDNGNAFLMSWKRREIENYLLSYTLLKKHSILDKINEQLPAVSQLKENNSNDNEHVRTLDVKKVLQPLYLKEELREIQGTSERGVDFKKLKALIDEIPTSEISDDIVKVYNFIKNSI